MAKRLSLLPGSTVSMVSRMPPREESRMRSRRRSAIVSSLVVGALLLAACGDGEVEAEAEAPVDEAPEVAEEEPVATEPAGERELSVWVDRTVRGASPLVGRYGPDYMLMSLVYDTLFKVNPAGEVVGSLAESWEVSADGMSITIDLVQDAVWSDGTPFTAQDVIFSYSLFSDPSIAAAAARFNLVEGVNEFRDGTADTVSGFEADGDHRLIVRLSEPDATWVDGLLPSSHYIIPHHILGDVPRDELPDHEFLRHPDVSIGPFLMVDHREGQYVELVRNDSFRMDVGLDRLFMVEGDADAATARLETGDIDLMIISPTDFDRINGLDHIDVMAVPAVGPMRMAALLDDGALLTDARVRQAIMHGIDRQQIVDQVLGGLATVLDVPLALHLIVDRNAMGSYDYDPDRARELLAEAGWDESTTVRLNYIAGSFPGIDTIGAIIQGQLGEVGLNVDLQPMEAGPLVEGLTGRDFDLTMYGGGVEHASPSMLIPTHTCVNVQPAGPNNAGFCNERVDELFAEARTATTEAEQAAIYQEMAEILFEEVPYVWLFVPDSLWAKTTRVEGFEPTGDGGVFWNAHLWTVTD